MSRISLYISNLRKSLKYNNVDVLLNYMILLFTAFKILLGKREQAYREQWLQRKNIYSMSTLA